jgi:hypothetical protein
MDAFSATAEAFRLIFRRPAIALAEIAWRWSLAVAAWFLGVVFLLEYVNSLPVNTADRLLLASRQPTLVWRALERILHGSGLRFTESGIVLGIGLVVAWIILASLGRAATLKAVIAHLGVGYRSGAGANLFASLVGLNFLRATVAGTGVVAAIGATLITSGIWASTHLSVAGAVRLWLFLVFLVGMACIVLNWVLSVAAMVVAENSLATFPAIVAAVGWFRERLGSVLAIGSWFGLAHTGAFLVAAAAAFTLFAMAAALGPGATLFLLFLIVALYSATADFLYIGRLVAYLAIDGGERSAAETSNVAPPGGPSSSAVDQSELIVCDVPWSAT